MKYLFVGADGAGIAIAARLLKSGEGQAPRIQVRQIKI